MLQHFLSALLVLQFDGSIRPPRDTGFNKAGLGRMASVGAAVFDNEDSSLLSLGGKSIEIVPDLTSADIEYDGLILGLGWLSKRNKAWWAQRDNSLTILGDCKAVIDQINGRSAPQKMLWKYEEAIELLDIIEKKMTITFGSAEIKCEHILRKENTLTDAVCIGVMKTLEQKAVADLEADIESAELGDLSRASKKQAKKKSVQSPLSAVLSRYFGSDSLIRHSIRPSLIRKALDKAEALDDGVAIQSIGELLESEAKSWPSLQDGGVASHSKESLTVEGVKLQIRGLQMRKREKEVDKLQHKHRYLLSQFDDGDEIATSSFLLGSSTATATFFEPEEELMFDLVSKDEWKPGFSLWNNSFQKKCFDDGPGRGFHQDVWIKSK
mmetsp:Transcript_21449/g.30321  ORF Transcript_21449/g.30321 Transcript_21449/m.30321 type:complete len:382 (+) Transcript_21449:23-1168(+)